VAITHLRDSSNGFMTGEAEESVVEAVRGGDQAAFVAVVERYRRQLHVHCYRMLGSIDDAEDLVQETFLRAWRARASFEGRAVLRTWLYRIATNACLNALERAPRRVIPQDVGRPVTVDTPVSEARAQPTWAPELPWLQPYPDSLLEPTAPTEDEPEAATISRETIELVFLAALQHLSPRQRAVLILRDALHWSARETASLLDTSVASVNSAHQRARATMRTAQPRDRIGDVPPAERTDEEQDTLQTFMRAWERADTNTMTALLRDDARWAMPPAPLWFDGRAAIVRLYEHFPIDWQGRAFRILPTAANRQPAAAAYLRLRGGSDFSLSAIHVLRIEGAAIAEVTTFAPELCRAFALPETI